jgi:hypothetical protein
MLGSGNVFLALGAPSAGDLAPAQDAGSPAKAAA